MALVRLVSELECSLQVVLRGLDGEALASALGTGEFLVSAVQTVGEHLSELSVGRVFLGDARVRRPHEHAYRRLRESLVSE